MRSLFLLTLTLVMSFGLQAKDLHSPSSFGYSDLNDNSRQWSLQRSRQTDNFILFWEAGYGSDPATASDAAYRVNIDQVLRVAETSFAFYRDELRFVHEGQSKTDRYKMIILLHYSTDWQANGSGVDETIGLLSLSASAGQAAGVTVAHEVAHCFQYQVQADGFPGGWRYGLGPNGEGGNGWWEQCAQWQAFKVFPNEQFTNHNYGQYLGWRHKNLLHEAPRYASYFIQDYWTWLHGQEFIGQLWQQSQFPEDPVMAYKRLNNLNQDQFNDEMYQAAARLLTWDLPVFAETDKDQTDSHPSAQLLPTDNNFWRIAPEDSPEDYGYNTIRLNLPEPGTTVHIDFEGLAGSEDYRTNRYAYAGWRYGVVALLDNGQRWYGEMRAPKFNRFNHSNPSDRLSFESPQNAVRLWLVVVGAPLAHAQHLWDDDDSNDEQWPYQVKFTNTNPYGVFEFEPGAEPENIELSYTLYQLPFTGNANPYPATPVVPDWERVCRAFKMQLSELKTKIGNSIRYAAVQPNNTLNYNSTANAPGHWFNATGYTTNWGNNSRAFSEFKTDNLSFNLGQYPNVNQLGNQFTLRQALVYTPATGPAVQATFTFLLNIGEEEVATALPSRQSPEAVPVPSVHAYDNHLELSQNCQNLQLYNLQGQAVRQAFNSQTLSTQGLPSGIYLLRADQHILKVVLR